MCWLDILKIICDGNVINCFFFSLKKKLNVWSCDRNAPVWDFSTALGTTIFFFCLKQNQSVWKWEYGGSLFKACVIKIILSLCVMVQCGYCVIKIIICSLWTSASGGAARPPRLPPASSTWMKFPGIFQANSRFIVSILHQLIYLRKSSVMVQCGHCVMKINLPLSNNVKGVLGKVMTFGAACLGVKIHCCQRDSGGLQLHGLFTFKIQKHIVQRENNLCYTSYKTMNHQRWHLAVPSQVGKDITALME